MGEAVEAALDLSGTADDVRLARRLVTGALHACGLDDRSDLVEHARTVVSELVTNAIIHGGPPLSLRVLANRDLARVEVRDGSRRRPIRPISSADSMTGRGLPLVTAMTADWGVEALTDGKVVWAEINGRARYSTADDAEIESTAVDIDRVLASWADLEPVDDEPRFQVRLGDVPTELLLAAKRHVDNLIREFTLATKGEESGSPSAMPPRLAALIRIVSTRFTDGRQAIKRQAIDAAARGDVRTRLQLVLPVSAADDAEEYLAALDEVDDYARAARLLTLETPPQHRAFRHWYVSSVVQQLRAIARGLVPPLGATFEEYLLGELETVAAARRIADRGARLQSVTAALASATVPEQVAAVVVSEGVAALAASGGSLFIPVDAEHLAMPGAVGYPEHLVEQLRAERRDAPLPAAEALRTGKAIWLESRADLDARYPDIIGLEPETMSICALPLAVDGHVLGALRFSFDRQRLFDDDERAFALALAAQTAAALDRARLFEAERAARARTAFLAEATELLTSSLEPEQTLTSLVSLLVPAYADWAVVLLRDQNATVRRVGAGHRDPKVSAVLHAWLPSSEIDLEEPGGLAEALRTGRTIRYTTIPPELTVHLAAAADTDIETALTPSSGLAVPLMVRGAVVGALGLARVGDQPPYDVDEQRIVEDLAARAAVAVLNAAQYARERDTALTLQRSLLPQQLPAIPGVSFAWRYLPGAAGSLVGGDWYDVIPLGDSKVALVIGDVMGRGLQAAAIMGQLRAAARAYASAHMPPAAVLEQLDAAVGRLEQGEISTMTLGVLDLSTRTLTVASAGHLPPLIVPRGERPFFLQLQPGPPLGVGEPRYPTSTASLDPGAMLLLYTDGLVEDRLRAVDVGMAALRQAAEGTKSAEALCDAALSALDRAQQHDDDTALLAVAVSDQPTDL